MWQSDKKYKKIEDIHNNMSIIFFFISYYSVVYVKYTYCLEGKLK